MAYVRCELSLKQIFPPGMENLKRVNFVFFMKDDLAQDEVKFAIAVDTDDSDSTHSEAQEEALSILCSQLKSAYEQFSVLRDKEK